MALELVEGWTKSIPEQLLSNGAPLNLTALTVTLQVTPTGKRTPKTLAGSTSITSAATGSVQFTPAAGDLLAQESPYAVRWNISDGSTCPNGTPNVWLVRKP